ncbi:hypothetical phage membrane protein [Campylobacter phage CPt10]|uniref:Uncharacterized protein n=2 Tax=Firehammervirus CPt10 TaxID=722418 RepID=A0A410T7N1_9CAUD|nr:membrane protein [Campylobacter phage CPt10]QAU04820.1 hypothetical protein [Campylobacter phage CP20]CBJ94282.1 hypothetical phage membrane protein [Campylobacter phage CPt10]
MKIFKNIKFLFYAILVLIIICDIMSLITSGKLTIEPATYALILVAICIEEVIYTRNKIIEEIKGIDVHIKLNDYLMSTSNTKTRYLNTKPETEAKTTKTKVVKTESKAKESKSKVSKAKTESKTDKEILKDMLNGAE